MNIAANCAVAGIPVNLDRLFFESDRVYRLVLLAVMGRVSEINREIERKQSQGAR